MSAIRRADGARLAQVGFGMLHHDLRASPGQTSVGRTGAIDDEGTILVFALEESPIVMKESEVIAVFQPHQRRHRHNAAKIADGLQLGPGQAIVVRARHADGVEARKHDQPFDAGRIFHAVERGDFLRRCPGLRNRKPVAPSFPRVVAAFHDDRAPAVSFRVHTNHGLLVFEQHRGGVAEVLSGLAIHHNLPL